MKKSEVKEALDALRKTSRRLSEIVRQLSDARTDVVLFQKQIEALGQPHYKDEAAMLKLATLERQKAACTKAIEQLESQAAEFIQTDGIPVAAAAGQEIGRAMQPAAALRLETITLVIRQFYRTLETAQKHAEESDCYAAAKDAMHRWNSLNSTLSMSDRVDGEFMVRLFDELETILVEATKPKPDLNQFMPFVREPDPEPATTAAS